MDSGLAYALIPNSYEWLLRRLEAVEDRIQRFMVFTATVTVGFPLVIVGLNGDAKLLNGWWAISASVFFAFFVLTRDHMTDMELVLTMLGETSTAELARARDSQGFSENKETAHAGGKIAGDARENFERQLGRPVVSSSNFLPERGDQRQLPQGEA